VIVRHQRAAAGAALVDTDNTHRRFMIPGVVVVARWDAH
jgi:hypothetical protein